jgi:FkbM family methyltransferase
LGWRGIHIEPVPAYAELLRQDRPDELVFELALGAEEGELTLNVIPDTGLSTAVKRFAETHEQHGFTSHTIKVPLNTLASVLAPNGNQDIHWLKIDVEGFEKEVLQGWDSHMHRPWVMVVESTEPLSQNESYTQWDHFLVSADYEFVHFDGVNRFYVACEHLDLKHAFASSINVFDDFILSEHASPQKWLGIQEQRDKLLAASETRAQSIISALKSEINQSETKLEITQRKQVAVEQQLVKEIDAQVKLQSAVRDSEQKLVELQQQTLQQEALIADAAKQILVMRQSVSWRLTKPIRLMSSLLPSKLRWWLRARLASTWRFLSLRDAVGERHSTKSFYENEQDKVMKIKIRALGRRISSWPVIGGFIRIIIAVIRLPEERIQFRQHMAEHRVRMQNEESALAATNARLARHEQFLTMQVPRLAQKVAEARRSHPSDEASTS